MSETKHPWCRDVSRDEAIRAAEDAAAAERTPLPDHRDLSAAVAELRERVAALEDHFADANEMVTPPQITEGDTLATVRDGGGRPMPKGPPPGLKAKTETAPADGLRTERVTLEITQRADTYVPLHTLNWQWILRKMPGGLLPGESVRVVDGASSFWARAAKRLTAERDAALRERDAAKEEAEKATTLAKGLEEKRAYFRKSRDDARAECERLRAERDYALLVLPACCGRLSDAAETVVQERDHARSRVAELLKDCETYGRTVLALQGQCDLANARVAELEAAAAPAANAGGEQQEPVAWGVRRSDGTWWRDCRATRGEMLSVVTGGGDANNVVSALYAAPQPPRGWLTEEERETLEDAADAAESWGRPSPSAKVIRALLARSTPPRVKVPPFVAVEDWHTRDRKWIAAIREAGGEVQDG